MDVDGRHLMRSSVPLVFGHCGSKLYAKTPAGEYAYGDSQGLYEWRDGRRIHYSGGDRQGSSEGRFWQPGPPQDRCGRPWPHQLGIAAVLTRVRLN